MLCEKLNAMIYHEKSNKVLILVVMEDALRDNEINENPDVIGCLNPCCNGRCSASAMIASFNPGWDQGLNPCCNGRCSASLIPHL